MLFGCHSHHPQFIIEVLHWTKKKNNKTKNQPFSVSKHQNIKEMRIFCFPVVLEENKKKTQKSERDIHIEYEVYCILCVECSERAYVLKETHTSNNITLRKQ